MRVREVLREMRRPAADGSEPDARRPPTKPRQGPNEPDDVFAERLREWERAVGEDSADVPEIVAGAEDIRPADLLANPDKYRKQREGK